MNSKSIEYVLNHMGIHETKRNSDWITMSCPLAPWTHAGGTDRKPSFGVRETTGISGVHCFSCGFKGGMLSLVRTYGQHAVEDGLMTKEEVRELEDYVILAEDEDTVDKPVNKITEAVISDQLRRCLELPHPYFEERAITQESVREWSLGYVEDFTDERTFATLHKRALFPVYEKVGLRFELKGIVGRTTIGEEPKYKNVPPNFQKSRFVYGGWLAEGKSKIAVVEGPVDAIALNQRLKEAERTDMFAIALLGADPSDAQIGWLKDNAEEVICMLDNDPSGKLGIKKLINGLEDHLLVSVVEWEDGVKDPDEAGKQVIAMIDKRISILEHRLMRVLKRNEQG